MEKYYNQTQIAQLEKQAEILGREKIQEVENEWPKLQAKVQEQMDANADPASPTVQALARRWRELVAMFTGGDPGIEQGLSKFWQHESSVAGVDMQSMRAMMEYIQRALAQSVV